MFNKHKRTLLLSLNGDKIFATSFKDFAEQIGRKNNHEEINPLIEFRKDRSIPSQFQVGYKVGGDKYYAYQQLKIKL